jgi:hypothetical protein
MRRELLLIIIVLFISINIHANDEIIKKDTTKVVAVQPVIAKKDSTKSVGWHPKALVGLNISQISLKNWSQGGDNSMTWISSLNGGMNYYSLNGWEFSNTLKLSYGRTKLGGQNFRTNDNELYLESVLSRHIGWTVDPFFSNNVRTSITNGYSYTQNTPVEIANFFDPAYVTQSFGFTYDKNKIFRTRLGVAAQEIFADEFRQYTNDTTVSRSKTFKLDTGMESVTNSEFEIAENIKMQSSLRLFTRFESLDVWDIRWENVITGKVNSFLNMNFSYLLIYQKDQSLSTQMKEGLNVGFVYAFL